MNSAKTYRFYFLITDPKTVPNFNTLHSNNPNKIISDYVLLFIKKYNLSYQ